ncbi:MAG: rRNA (Guanine-N(2)-)-methyltransferase [Clostridia bacterium 41_269]|nr:MAG: rRNA (Guanine-N(2)-)-methyltransferase [Clostridia bacterium 41_269]
MLQIKETLAAGLVILSKWEPEIPLIDPFCGSGTIPIEAALIGLNIAPGINRNFAAENWPQIPKKLWEKCRMEAKEKINLSKKLDIAGYDADAEAIKIAQSNALKAMVGNQISFEQRSLNQLSSKKKYGKIICNPPYGERLGSKKEVEKLYKEMGRFFKKLDTWSYYILTSHRNFEKLFGRKATKKRKLYNGDIRVDYYQYYGPKPPKTAT